VDSLGEIYELNIMVSLETSITWTSNHLPRYCGQVLLTWDISIIRPKGIILLNEKYASKNIDVIFSLVE
jgi:hypothetical protein